MSELTTQRLFGALFVASGVALFFAFSGFAAPQNRDRDSLDLLGQTRHQDDSTGSYSLKTSTERQNFPSRYKTLPVPTDALVSNKITQFSENGSLRRERDYDSTRGAEFADRSQPSRMRAQYPPPQKLGRRQGLNPDKSNDSAGHLTSHRVLKNGTSSQYDFVDLPKLAAANSRQASDSILDVTQSSYEAEIPERDSNPIRIDKRVRKANWNEIEMASPIDTARTFRQQQQATLVRKRTNPQVEDRAREHIKYGESLARRSALFAAREEFIRALLLISGSYNTGENPSDYPERVAQALTAIDESRDFALSSREANHDRLFQQRILAHKTPLIAPQNIATTSAMKAIGIYSSFAQAQLEQAIGFSVAGSEALHALGKLESMGPETNSKNARMRQTNALVFFRAAINVNPSNALCANDLGVLLFNMGRLQEAEGVLKASLSSSQSQLGWSNLAAVHNQLAAAAANEQDRNYQLWLANAATENAKQFTASQNHRLASNQWATANEFKDNAAFPDTVAQHAANRDSENTSASVPGKSAALLKKVKGWF